MMNLAAAAPARGVLLMQPVGEVREAFSTREIYGLGVFDAPGFWKKLVRRVKRMAAFLPGIFAYHEGFLRFSGSSGCTSRRTWGRICNTRKDLCEKSSQIYQSFLICNQYVLKFMSTSIGIIRTKTRVSWPLYLSFKYKFRVFLLLFSQQEIALAVSMRSFTLKSCHRFICSEIAFE
jgi:hypothetical protein